MPAPQSGQEASVKSRISVAQATSDEEAPYTNLPGITRHRTALFTGSGNPSLVFSTGEVLPLSPGDLVMVEAGEPGGAAEVTLNGAKLIHMDVWS